jgi:hypothetical protein
MRNVQVRLQDLEVGDTIVHGGATFIYDHQSMSLNNVVLLFNAAGLILAFPPGSAVTITIP